MMDKNILEEIIASASFEIDVFDGMIKIEGRILSPSEVESAGLASAMLAHALFKSQTKEEILKAQNLAQKVESGEIDDIEDLLEMASAIKPEQLEQIAEREDRLLIKCVRRCSKDGGKTWEPLHLVTAIDQQNAKQNRLWVGMLKSEDRRAILDKAMKGHEEATERLQTFRS
tara:strand:+ start:904 stop:1419 length:516 start_codon:yes stop_codon:yes gene_type:complete